MPANRFGFSVLEMMISVTVASALLLGLLTMTRHFQLTAYNLQRLYEREQNLSLLPMILSRLIPPAGNQHWRSEWAGIGWSGAELSVSSDLNGPDGFPDGSGDGDFETLRLRARGGSLQLSSGRGTFQPLLRNVTRLEFERPSPDLLQLQAAGRCDSLLLWPSQPVEREVEVFFWLRNYQVSLFAQDQ